MRSGASAGIVSSTSPGGSGPARPGSPSRPCPPGRPRGSRRPRRTSSSLWWRAAPRRACRRAARSLLRGRRTCPRRCRRDAGRGRRRRGRATSVPRPACSRLARRRTRRSTRGSGCDHVTRREDQGKQLVGCGHRAGLDCLDRLACLLVVVLWQRGLRPPRGRWGRGRLLPFGFYEHVAGGLLQAGVEGTLPTHQPHRTVARTSSACRLPLEFYGGVTALVGIPAARSVSSKSTKWLSRTIRPRLVQ